MKLLALGLTTSLCLVAAAPTQRLFRSHTGSFDFGRSTANLGDINKDGVPDYAVGDPIDPKSGTNTPVGSVHVFCGKSGKRLFFLQGSTREENFGYFVAGVGDLDGDGRAEFAVGAPGSHQTYQGARIPGSVFVYSGKDVKQLYAWQGDNTYDRFGCGISSIADIDGDKVPDILVGAEEIQQTKVGDGLGFVRAFSGKTGKALWTVQGDKIGDHFGHRVVAMGDVDADKTPDFAVLAPGANKWQGYVRMISGRTRKPLFTFAGGPRTAEGGRLCNAGDIDGDGVDDVGVSYGYGIKSRAYGLVSGKTGKLIRDVPIIIQSRPVNVHEMASLGDVDGDGVPDMVVGAPLVFITIGNKYQSVVAVISGKTSEILASIVEPYASGPRATAAMGDLDGDGSIEFLTSNRWKALIYTLDLGRFSTFGTGCASATIPPKLSSTTRPRIGKQFTLNLTHLPTKQFGMLVVGYSDKAWGGQTLPLPLGFMGMKNCSLLVSWDVQLPRFVQASSETWKFTAPSSPAMIGRTIFGQMWVVDPKANKLGIATSNGGKAVLGL